MEFLFFPQSGSGTLDIHFKTRTAKKTIVTDKGFYWYGDNGELEGVEFEDVSEYNDEQVIKTEKNDWVKVTVKDGEISINSNLLKKKVA